MTNVKFNRKKFIRFMLFALILLVGAYLENGNITGALVLAMLIYGKTCKHPPSLKRLTILKIPLFAVCQNRCYSILRCDSISISLECI